MYRQNMLALMTLASNEIVIKENKTESIIITEIIISLKVHIIRTKLHKYRIFNRITGYSVSTCQNTVTVMKC